MKKGVRTLLIVLAALIVAAAMVIIVLGITGHNLKTTSEKAGASSVAAGEPQTLEEKFAYSLGAYTYDMYSQYYKIDTGYFLKGAQDWSESNALFTQEEMNNILMEYQMQQQNEGAEENLKAAEDFLANNASAEGVVTTESGTQYKVIETGNGAIPTPEDTVEVDYTLTLLDGSVVDGTNETTGPATFALSNLIPGFTEAVCLVPEGSTIRVWIHPDNGYGSNATGSIPANSLLTFDITLHKIVK